MSLTDLLLGRPLATREEGAERIGPAAGIPIFGLDALSSAAYGPEAALTLLIPLGLAGVGSTWVGAQSIAVAEGQPAHHCDQRAVVPEKLASHASRDCA
jgi:hypothetical protein